MADELERYLDSLSDALERKLSAAVEKEAQALSDAQHAALLALESDPDETGNLAASCVVVPGENSLEWIVQAGGELTTKEIREGSGVGYDYALAFEHGTTRQPARPFFWPTYRERRDQIEANIAKAVDEVLK